MAPCALERLSVRQSEYGCITRVRYPLLPHKAANWGVPGCGRKSTRPSVNGVVELSFRRRKGAAQGKGAVPRGGHIDKQTGARRHGASHRKRCTSNT